MRSERSYYDTIPSGVKVTYRILSKSVCGGQTRTVGDSSCVEVEASPQTGSGLGTVYFYITDHLGTVRAILDVDGNIKSTHDFEPFGVELQPLSAESTNFHYKYTGQERDDSTNLDYMHARFYGSSIGRFLRPDPEMKSARCGNPQSWNRYSYVENNPIVYVDPTGEVISLAKLTSVQQGSLLEGLKEFTGNEYKVDEKGNLQLVSVGENSSATATEFLNNAISSETTYNVNATTEQSHWGGQGTTDVYINFQTFEGANYGKVNPSTFNLGSSLVHETWHAVNQLGDVDKTTGASYQDKGCKGPAVEFENKIRAERGLLQRRDYFIFDTSKRGQYAKVPFYDPQKPNKVYFVEIFGANAGL